MPALFALVASRRGLSTSEKVVQLLHRHVDPMFPGEWNPIHFGLVVAPLRGVAVQVGDQPETTFERVVRFDGSAFDTLEEREAIYRAATASAAFPVIFEAVDIPGLGPCYDGGVVNDTPVSFAIDAGATHVIIIAPYPQSMQGRKPPIGF